MINIVTPASISKEKVCECYPECMNCPLRWGSRNCEELEQNEINDIMYIVEVVERRTQTPFHKFGMSKEIMARLRAKLKWNEKCKIEEIPATDVQPVLTIKKLQEHIKQRILETGFNNGGIYGEVAEDIADHIDIWVDEFGRNENG